MKLHFFFEYEGVKKGINRRNFNFKSCVCETLIDELIYFFFSFKAQWQN